MKQDHNCALVRAAEIAFEHGCLILSACIRRGLSSECANELGAYARNMIFIELTK